MAILETGTKLGWLQPVKAMPATELPQVLHLDAETSEEPAEITAQTWGQSCREQQLIDRLDVECK